MIETLVPATQSETNSQPETSTDGKTRREGKQDTYGAESAPAAVSESPQNGTANSERPRASRVPLREKRPVVDQAQSPKSPQQKRQKSRLPQQNEVPPKENEARLAKRLSRKSSSPAAQRDNQTRTNDLQRYGDSNASEASQGPAADASADAGRQETEIPRAITTGVENKSKPDHRPSSRDEAQSKSKRGRSRNAKAKSSQPAKDAATQLEPEQIQENETRDEPVNAVSQASSKKKRTRRRPSPAQTTPDTTAEEATPETEAEVPDDPATAQSEARHKTKRSRRTPPPAGKTGKATEVEDRPVSPAESPAAARESSTSATRRGRKASKKRDANPQPESVEPELEATQELEPEPEADAHPETEAGSSRARRGRSNKGKGKRAAEPEERHSEEQPDTEAPQEPRRKTREPRGDTVPVTVHRLANASALGAMYASAEGPGNEDEESPDGLLSRLNTKMPSRGGVNPADVLSQICRETLEKTLDKLKAGIENETNTQKRAEWSRKRKAVEAFGLELDSRLLDLSEILDSNFVLGMQLRKAKRDMMDLRSHLYKVRKERESIAIQMDAVRAKHMEEENAKTVSILIICSA